MAITPTWYGNGLKNALGGAVDLDTDTIKGSLHTTTYTPNVDTHDFFDDATNELATASGYTARGVTLASKVLSIDSGTHQVRWDFDDLTWTFSAAVTFRYLVLSKVLGGATSADPLIAYFDWGSSQTVSGIYVVSIDATGALYVDYA